MLNELKILAEDCIVEMKQNEKMRLSEEDMKDFKNAKTWYLKFDPEILELRRNQAECF